ncbi:oncoprotein-induced transcript 3 protein-like [Pecten maximus]|uniref:oncoprotein-induced transcript 3 protein-like n=1 Tax=Pecten maximus TaxID=6579 RepID=UPI0014583AFD|nr:oncoprotein-induced transcript 3 protein-like [Pecten maximus]
MAMIVFIFTFGLLLQGSEAEYDPCVTATDLHRAGDRGTGCADLYDQVCDRYAINETVWYKVENKHGDNLYKDMVTSAPELNHCGTSFPIWLNGILPHGNHTQKNLTVCMQGLENACETSFNITVMNCHQYHVYKLKPTDTCNAAYCFGHERCQSTPGHTTSKPTVDPAALEPCDTSHNLHQAGERGTECSIGSSDTICDRYAVEDVWYRVTNGGGEDLELVTKPQHINMCGTSFPIWMNGTHPTGGSVVNRTACQHGIEGSCIHQYNISVKHCDSYFVYKLQKTLICDAAYCFGQDKQCENPDYNSNAAHASPLTSLLAVHVAILWMIGRQSFFL